MRRGFLPHAEPFPFACGLAAGEGGVLAGVLIASNKLVPRAVARQGPVPGTGRAAPYDAAIGEEPVVTKSRMPIR